MPLRMSPVLLRSKHPFSSMCKLMTVDTTPSQRSQSALASCTCGGGNVRAMRIAPRAKRRWPKDVQARERELAP